MLTSPCSQRLRVRTIVVAIELRLRQLPTRIGSIGLVFIASALFAPFGEPPEFADVRPTLSLATAVGQQKSITFAAASRLTLNTDTTIKIRYTSGGNSEILLKKGEVLFNVAHDTSRRVKVVAGDLLVTDLGTTFDVHLRSPDSALVSGRARNRCRDRNPGGRPSGGGIADRARGGRSPHP